MGISNKTDNFLSAIEKYAQQQKLQMVDEVEQFKAAELKKAEDEGIKDAYAIIQKEIAIAKTKITSELACKEHEKRVELFTTRQKITDEIFAKAKSKLITYTETDQYKDKLLSSAKKIADLFGDNTCVLYVAEKDLGFTKEIVKLFSGTTSVAPLKDIEIGGIQGSCEKLSIIADETLDSKLQMQMDWFVKNSSLKVVE